MYNYTNLGLSDAQERDVHGVGEEDMIQQAMRNSMRDSDVIRNQPRTADAMDSVHTGESRGHGSPDEPMHAADNDDEIEEDTDEEDRQRRPISDMHGPPPPIPEVDQEHVRDRVARNEVPLENLARQRGGIPEGAF